MKTSEIISAGNGFGMPFAVAFLFVYFAIIDPHYSRDTRPERYIEYTLRQIETTEGQLQAKLDRIHDRDEALSMSLVGKAPGQQSFQESSVSALLDQMEKEADAEATIREKLVQLGVAHQTLSKAKSDKKEYSIPLISVSINEETLLRFFPLLVLLGLVRLLFYRANLLRSLPGEWDECLPIWAAPLPFKASSLSFTEWVEVNFCGFAGAGVIIYLLARFVLFYARENSSSAVLALEELGLILLWVLMYLFIVIAAIIHKPAAQVVEPRESDII